MKELNKINSCISQCHVVRMLVGVRLECGLCHEIVLLNICQLFRKLLLLESWRRNITDGAKSRHEPLNTPFLFFLPMAVKFSISLNGCLVSHISRVFPGAVSESQRYCTVHCTGYMRTWPTSQLGTEGEAEADKESSHFSCLVAMGRVHPHTIPQANGEIKVKPTEFITRCAMDGKFTFVDQRYVNRRILWFAFSQICVTVWLQGSLFS